MCLSPYPTTCLRDLLFFGFGTQKLCSPGTEDAEHCFSPHRERVQQLNLRGHTGQVSVPQTPALPIERDSKHGLSQPCLSEVQPVVASCFGAHQVSSSPENTEYQGQDHRHSLLPCLSLAMNQSDSSALQISRSYPSHLFVDGSRGKL